MKTPYHKHALPSGLTTLLVPMEGVQSATVLALVNTGSRFEPHKWSGISHFLEHMVFKGTAKYPTAQDLASTVDSIGAEFNAFTSKEYTGYYVKAASAHIPLAVDVVSDMLMTPQLRQDDLEREKGVIVEEIHMYEDTPARHIGDVFEQLIYAGTTLGRDIIGTEKTVRVLKREDFRQYLKDWYGPKNITVVIAGDAAVLKDTKKILSLVEERFSKDGGERKDGVKRELYKSPYSKKKFIQAKYKKTEQAHFVLAYPGLTRTDKDRHILSVLTALFGGNMSSRLFTEVREKRGLCYYVHSDVDVYHDAGIFGASAGVDKSRIEEAVRVVQDEFTHLMDSAGSRAITDQEVQKAKDYLTGKTVLDFEDSQNVAMFYGSKHMLEGKVETEQEVLERIGKVTREDILRLTQRLLKDVKPYFAVIGPYRSEEPFEKLLQ